ncbi:MAG: DNA polymerase II, partial [Planctomycetes bacterium]|nr:DNA polymerase II [Planctomycetota bacterium]
GMPEVIAKAYREDRQTFCEYCLEDSRLVQDILKAEGLIELSLRRSLLTGLPLDRAWGSVAAFEFLYMTELHKRQMVAPTVGVDQPDQVGAPGGLVMALQSGLYRNVLVFDFKSLYPSIIRTFNIDPLAHIRARDARKGTDVIRAPNGATFDREPGILPAMLEQFFASRDRAKADGDDLASYAYKIVMNSFYGVLATASCRFASGELAGAITQFGHYLLRWAQQLLEKKGHHVLYGDTDSLFVDAGLENRRSVKAIHAEGRKLCTWINRTLAKHVKKEFGVPSRLELEFEKVYQRLFLPPMRGTTDRARAKGYAGLRIDEQGKALEIIGMEAVRRDWTELAHALQRDLLLRLFHDETPADLERCIVKWIRDLRAGKKDKDLVYHKALRKAVAKYTRTTPPHVKAAKLLPKPSGVIHYVMTTAGPQPVGHLSAPIDYNHYIRKQIEPIVRTIAQVCPLDVNAAIKGERSLFAGM